MLKDITFGQYFESNSFVHKLDPRSKLLLLILIIVSIFVAQNAFALSVVAIFIILSVFLSKIPIKMYLKNIKAILPIIIFTMIINLFYNASGTILISFWKLTITTGSIYRALYMSARILLLIISSAELTYTTTPNELTDAIEKLLAPLRFVGLKNAVHTLAMMMTIALRFIPTLIEETQKIMNAQKARGADLENGKLIERIKALVPILIPLLISSVRRAYELAEAMECRCYNGGEGRVRMKQLKYSISDYISFVVVLVVMAVVILINIFL
ncbi:MAG: energy-coupling factor transporter transmembrane protein EcfT [Ruminococcaceae bacterium]|nr:energy-coupling factor transporter transmembrane protein EcfT [Oscillospiraceae bacterium]